MPKPKEQKNAYFHFERLQHLLDLEGEAEQSRLHESIQRLSPAAAERSGQALVRLVISDETGGLGGRILVTLTKRNQQEDLPWTQLRTGTPVQLSVENSTDSGENNAWRGVVSELRRDRIQVALNTWPETESDRPTFRVDLAGDEVARQRQRKALQRVAAAKADRLAELRSVLLLDQPPISDAPAPFTPLDADLNDPQRGAVAHALAARDVAVIHGPPGTGKTTAVVELIRQAVRRGERVLACAPSNLAVDNIFERLLDVGEAAVRLGHPARVRPELREQTLELLVENHPDMRTVRNLHKEAHALRNRASRWTRAKPAPGERQQQRNEAKAMLADARRLERGLVEQVLDGAQILCATTSGLDDRLLGDRRFDLCVIDEAGQSTEPGCWLPLLRSERVVLAGDPFQLPPTVISKEAEAAGFNVSMLERLVAALPGTVRLLTVQYRMNRDIMNFSSAEFYGGALVAAERVAAHRLCDLGHVAENELTERPVTFIDTAGAGYDEALEPDGESRLNEGEAELVLSKVEALLHTGISPAEIAVIAPYSAQVRLLRELMRDYMDDGYMDDGTESAGLEINSIDGFQGRESEVVIISLVRANDAGEIGFLADTRRMNVALTRARRKLIVIGDSATIGGDPFYGRLLDYFDTIGAYSTVWEEIGY